MAKGNKLIDDRKQISVNLIKLKSHGKHFEIAIDPDKAVEFKEGKEIAIEEIIQAHEIFTDMKKGLIASPEDLEVVFNTTDVDEIVKIMLQKGEIQFTQSYRQKLHEQKFRKIVNIIHRNAIDPKTKLPHPINRIEAAIDEAKIKIDYNQGAEEQVKEIITKLQPIIPLSIEETILSIHVGANYAGSAQSLVRSHGTLIGEQWLGDGGGIFKVKIAAGRSQDLIDQLNNQTHGSVQIEIEKSA